MSVEVVEVGVHEPVVPGPGLPPACTVPWVVGQLRPTAIHRTRVVLGEATVA